MAVPQGLTHFGGIESLLSASYTLTHGITPGVATLYVPPQPGMVARMGPLRFAYGSTRITFPDCILDKISVEHGQDGRIIWALHILDRRWKWKFAGRISGYYNVRRGGKEIINDTEATPRELAKLCLKAMGERRFNLSKMPDDARPEIEWDYTLPAEALARLCDSLGCRVVLRLNNSVSVEQAGVGAALPAGHDVLAESAEADPAERPDSLIFVAGPTRYQHNFELEAVGRDKDDTVKPVDDLSYTPRLVNGQRSWTLADELSFNCILDKKYRALAKESVFRWYRIKTPIKARSEERDLTNLDRILPIEDVQVETWTVDGRIEPRPAWIYGRYDNGLEAAKPPEDDIYHDLKNKPQTIYTDSFGVEKETGIVKFAESVHRREWLNGLSTLHPADLRLRVACSIRDEDTRGWKRYEVKRKMSGANAGTLPRYLVHDDIALQYWQNFVPPRTGMKDNKPDVDSQAKYYLDAAEQEYQWDSPCSATYAGFKTINPSGAVQQVTWMVDQQGFATTRASRNREELLVTPSYKERRFTERLHTALKRDAKTGRQKQADQERGRA